MKEKTLNHLNALDRKLSSLLNKLSEIDPEKLTQKPSEKEWSVVQIMNHLMISESLSKSYCRKKLSYNPELKNVSIKTKWNEFVLRTYLQTPIKFKAPKAVDDSVFPTEIGFVESKDKWLRDRIELKEFLQSLPKEIFYKELYKHPFGMRIGLNGMLGFFESHYDRHHRQINRTLRRINY